MFSARLAAKRSKLADLAENPVYCSSVGWINASKFQPTATVNSTGVYIFLFISYSTESSWSSFWWHSSRLVAWQLLTKTGYESNKLLSSDRRLLNYSWLFVCLQARLETKNFLQSTISRYYASTESTDAVSLMWNHLMGELRCCGVENYKDFDLSEKWRVRSNDRVVPEACCVLERQKGVFIPRDPTCPKSPSESNSHYMNVSTYFLNELELGYERTYESLFCFLSVVHIVGMLRGSN